VIDLSAATARVTLSFPSSSKGLVLRDHSPSRPGFGDPSGREVAKSPMWGRSGRITRSFHEKAGPCQAVFLVVPFVQPTADQREAQ
jgi:hypothetical protein